MNIEVKWTKEFVYYLGFLWADGSVYRKGIRLEIIETDMLDLLSYFMKINFINFKTHRRTRSGCKPQMSLYFCNCKLYDSFFSIYFNKKSTSSPKSLIDVIPTNLINYFYLGLIDGDGCFYISKNKNTQFSISSCFEQDWSHIEELFKLLSIKTYKVNRRVNKNNNNSQSSIRITNYDDIYKLYRFIYPNELEIGLKRKYDKCRMIIDNRPSITINNSIIDKDELVNKIDEFKSIEKVSEYFNCSNKKIYNYCKKYGIENDGFVQSRRLKDYEYMTYNDSKLYLHKFGLKSKKEWVEFCKNGKRPKNIPSNPFLFYKYKGWNSYGDWLGFK